MPEAPRVCVRQATLDDKPVIADLLQSYHRDMAPFTGAEPDGAGRYTYRYFDVYWSPEGVAEGRVPYLILADDAVVGFAFVNQHSKLGHPKVRNIAEFYVQKARRREGVGQRAARKLLAMHPGIWEIAVLHANALARAFWLSVVAEGRFEIVTTDPAVWNGTVISFESR